MPLNNSAVAVRVVSPFAAKSIDLPGYDQRWAAWQAKGAAHERAARRKALFIALPVMLTLAGLIIYAWSAS